MKGPKSKADSSKNDARLKSKSAGAGKRSKKAEKDPNKPKRPPSAFFVFMFIVKWPFRTLMSIISMKKHVGSKLSQLFVALNRFWRMCLFSILAVGPVPNHIAFIMDGNRRYAKKQNLAEGDGHKAGFLNLTSLLRYCYKLGVKYVTVYAFSIENFKRKPKEVHDVMSLMQEKIEELLQKESIVNEYGVRLHFVGNLKLLSEPVRVSVEKAMKATANNDKRVLLICVAYTSSDEIVHAVEEACKYKWRELNGNKYSDYGVQGINGVRDNYSRGAAQNSSSIKDIATSHIDPNTREAENVMLGEVTNDFWQDEYTEVGQQSSNMMVTGAEAEKNKAKQIEVPSISQMDIEKHLYMSVAPDPDIVIRSSGTGDSCFGMQTLRSSFRYA